MKPIKFRAWHKTARKMLTVANISLIDGYVTSHEQIEEGNFPEGPSDLIDTYEINEIYLMQFTGLQDKNGTDIYEGDIVKTKSLDPIGVVEFDTVEMTGALASEYWMTWVLKCTRYGYQSTICNHTAEIIGNIYQNGDLLK